MATKEELQAAVKAAETQLTEAQAALEQWDSLAENNVFETLEKALSTIEDKLRSKASDDCEGAYNCGLDEYSQEFIVGGTKYLATAKFEYNRHDKTYYYIDGCTFSHKEIEPVSV
jgi:hypothetical protein